MEYCSTRNKEHRVSAAQAISQGLSPDGGLYLPTEIPKLSIKDLQRLAPMNYKERCTEILSLYLDEFDRKELEASIYLAYDKSKFPKEVTPLVKIKDGLYSLELWHGPTSAFKDMALQLLPHLLTLSVKATQGTKKVVILVATSGDTGKAALEGFKDVKGTEILVFYPHGGVSPVQYLQMATQEGNNLSVVAVKGNFDDTQSKVKELFTSPSLISELDQGGYVFSSANSINWGRLVPQIVYYISGYLDLVNAGEILLGEEINVCVPTGNFGNILAAYYGKKMGLPIHKLICASNENNVLTDFFATGEYNKNRPFKLTSSPSMDILISSNLERLLYLLYKEAGEEELVPQLMDELKIKGKYSISQEIYSQIEKDFYGGYGDQEATLKAIKETFTNNNYLADPHTSVAISVYNDYMNKTGDTRKTLLVSTANPHKFPNSMLEALAPKDTTEGFEQVMVIKELTGLEIPPQIESLPVKAKRFTEVIAPETMESCLKQRLNI